MAKKDMYVVIDTETGGIIPQVHALLTLYAGVTDNEGNIIDERSYKILPRPNYTIQYAALQVNNIELAQHEQIALDALDVAEDLSQFLEQHKNKLGKRLIPLGWNVAFDLGFIYEHLIAKDAFEKYVSHRTMDVQVLSRFFYGDGTLKDITARLGIPFENAHTADADAKMTLTVFRALEERFKPKND